MALLLLCVAEKYGLLLLLESPQKHCQSPRYFVQRIQHVCPLDKLERRGGLAVSVSSYETTDPGSMLGVAIFPW